MNKSELVDAIAQDTGLSKKDSEAALKSFVEKFISSQRVIPCDFIAGTIIDIITILVCLTYLIEISNIPCRYWDYDN